MPTRTTAATFLGNQGRFTGDTLAKRVPAEGCKPWRQAIGRRRHNYSAVADRSARVWSRTMPTKRQSDRDSKPVAIRSIKTFPSYQLRRALDELAWLSGHFAEILRAYTGTETRSRKRRTASRALESQLIARATVAINGPFAESMTIDSRTGRIVSSTYPDRAGSIRSIHEAVEKSIVALCSAHERTLDAVEKGGATDLETVAYAGARTKTVEIGKRLWRMPEITGGLRDWMDDPSSNIDSEIDALAALSVWAKELADELAGVQSTVGFLDDAKAPEQSAESQSEVGARSPVPMTEKEKAVLALLDGLPPGEALTGAEICSRLDHTELKGFISESELTARVIPNLKQYHNIKNRRNCGYYIAR